MPPTTQPAARRNPWPDGRIDPLSRRSDRDVLDGYSCTIDLSDEEARAGVEAAVGEFPDNSVFGVYTSPAALDKNGWPLEAFVALRGEHGGAIVRVPYSALAPSQPGRRS